MKSENRLYPENCNKAKCKTCIFGQTPIELSAGRRAEIMGYLSNFSSSHICHTTEKTCYGALEFQASLLYRIGWIPENTVEALQKAAITALEVTRPKPHERVVPPSDNDAGPRKKR